MTAPWYDGRLAAFDVETSGVDYDADRIVTAAVAFVGGGLPTDSSTWLLNPGVEIAEEATAVHGITTEKARAEGVDPERAIFAILDLLSSACRKHWPIVAFNARFDLTMLDREARRYGMTPLGERDHALWVVDPLVIDKWLHRFRKGSRKLDAMCEHYGVTLDDAHEAHADAVAAARLAWVIGRRGEVVARMPGLVGMRTIWKARRDDLPALHAGQVGWAADQARSLAAYFESKGEPQVVEAAWPVVPFEAEAVAA